MFGAWCSGLFSVVQHVYSDRISFAFAQAVLVSDVNEKGNCQGLLQVFTTLSRPFCSTVIRGEMDSIYDDHRLLLSGNSPLADGMAYPASGKTHRFGPKSRKEEHDSRSSKILKLGVPNHAPSGPEQCTTTDPSVPGPPKPLYDHQPTNHLQQSISNLNNRPSSPPRRGGKKQKCMWFPFGSYMISTGRTAIYTTKTLILTMVTGEANAYATVADTHPHGPIYAPCH